MQVYTIFASRDATRFCGLMVAGIIFRLDTRTVAQIVALEIDEPCTHVGKPDRAQRSRIRATFEPYASVHICINALELIWLINAHRVIVIPEDLDLETFCGLADLTLHLFEFLNSEQGHH